MLNSRQFALEQAVNRTLPAVYVPKGKVTDYFGSHVFSRKVMQEYLSGEAFDKVKAAIHSKEKIVPAIAETVASAMKSWALSMGVSHYAHWFQPLSGQTAQKFDAFLTIKNGQPIEELKGSFLIQQGSDASDFPTGGLRSTFEARGYTAWDPSSPAFIMENGLSKTLCIPTIFVSYTGEALDYKSPLLKSLQFLEEHAVPVCNYFDRFVTRVYPRLGCEQEFYVIDEAFYKARPDLQIANRALIGLPLLDGQGATNHYFAALPERINHFMIDLEVECYKLGIPIRTKHNEVGASQFEIVPMHEEMNVSIDTNLLLMDLLTQVARRHKLRVLLHERPFLGLSGSAKHNNWSLHTDTGKNLFAPADTPRKNLLFLTFFLNTLKAIHDYKDVLKASVASAGNDLRIGSKGAPYPELSVYIGKSLSDVLADMEKRGDEWFVNEDRKQALKLDIHNKIPSLMRDNTDANRATAVAFTGNKFELRQVGASHNPASPMIVLNTILGTQLAEFRQDVDKLIKKKGLKKDAAILTILRKIIKSSKPIIHKENDSSVSKNTPELLEAYETEKAKILFEEAGILSRNELEARLSNLLTRYGNVQETEGRVMVRLIRNFVIPAASNYARKVSESYQSLTTSGLDCTFCKIQKETLVKICQAIADMDKLIVQLEQNLNDLDEGWNAKKKAEYLMNEVKSLLEPISEKANLLEELVDDQLWPLSTFQEILSH